MAKKMILELKKFALRGNLLDMAVGFTVGAAFTSIAKSLVNDIIMPPISFVLGRTDFTNLFLVLKEGTKVPGPYETYTAANQAGAVTLNYGLFFNNVVAFLMVAFAMFLLIKFVNKLQDEIEERFKEVDENPSVVTEEEVTNKKCIYCKTIIDIFATRCPACTSELPKSITQEIKEKKDTPNKTQ